MQKFWWVSFAALLLNGCAVLSSSGGSVPPVGPGAPPGDSANRRIENRERPLRTIPPPPSLPPSLRLEDPAWPPHRLPELRTPTVLFPKLPELALPTDESPPHVLQSDTSLDRHFKDWHLPDFTPSRCPELNLRLELDDFHRGLELPKVDIFSDLAPAETGDACAHIRKAMVELKIEQQKQKDKYVDFPIPTSLPLSF